MNIFLLKILLLFLRLLTAAFHSVMAICSFSPVFILYIKSNFPWPLSDAFTDCTNRGKEGLNYCHSTETAVVLPEM